MQLPCFRPHANLIGETTKRSVRPPSQATTFYYYVFVISYLRSFFPKSMFVAFLSFSLVSHRRMRANNLCLWRRTGAEISMNFFVIYSALYPIFLIMLLLWKATGRVMYGLLTVKFSLLPYRFMCFQRSSCAVKDEKSFMEFRVNMSSTLPTKQFRRSFFAQFEWNDNKIVISYSFESPKKNFLIKNHVLLKCCFWA